jgi:hypothetical protein
MYLRHLVTPAKVSIGVHELGLPAEDTENRDTKSLFSINLAVLNGSVERE